MSMQILATVPGYGGRHYTTNGVRRNVPKETDDGMAWIPSARTHDLEL